MKKVFLLTIACITLGIWGNLNAQNCSEIVRPYLLRNNIDSSEYPAGKAEWRCNYSRNAFYMTDKIPSDAFVYDFTELTSWLTGQHPNTNIVVELEHLSYWEYNFEQFQHQHFYNTIYFRLQNSSKKYLAVRNINEIYERTEYPEHFKK